MSLSVDATAAQWILRLDGDVNMTSAAELKHALLEAFSYGKELHFDLDHVRQIDSTVLQLLWAASRDARSNGIPFSSRVSEAAMSISRDAGFESWPGARENYPSGDGRG